MLIDATMPKPICPAAPMWSLPRDSPAEPVGPVTITLQQQPQGPSLTVQRNPGGERVLACALAACEASPWPTRGRRATAAAAPQARVPCIPCSWSPPKLLFGLLLRADNLLLWLITQVWRCSTAAVMIKLPLQVRPLPVRPDGGSASEQCSGVTLESMCMGWGIFAVMP